MEPKKVGRTLGIGVRVASNMLRQRAEQAAASRTAPVVTQNDRSATPLRTNFGVRAATARRGAGAFGRAFLGPFTHAGSILWLEITGLFFALFALFFVQSVYRIRGAWRPGPEHTHFLLYCALGAAFAWFSASSFLRAYRKTHRGPGGSPKR